MQQFTFHVDFNFSHENVLEILKTFNLEYVSHISSNNICGGNPLYTVLGTKTNFDNFHLENYGTLP